MIFLFNQFAVDTAQYQLSFEGKPVPIEPLVFDLLVYLIENRERVVG
jgi:DNA-binding winged helix-turn-helix (wHTH) protein